MGHLVCETCRRSARFDVDQLAVHVDDGTPVCRNPAGTRSVTSETINGGQCDFCSSPDPTVVFHAAATTSDMLIPGDGPSNDAVYTTNASADWLSCDDCAPLVRSRDTAALAERVWLTTKAAHRLTGDMKPMMVSAIVDLQSGFFATWRGRESAHRG